MAEWMTIVKQRNELTRRDTELGYRYIEIIWSINIGITSYLLKNNKFNLLFKVAIDPIRNETR